LKKLEFDGDTAEIVELAEYNNFEILSKEDKGHVFAMLDAFFAKAKLQSIM
jgi:hypothetical protein